MKLRLFTRTVMVILAVTGLVTTTAAFAAPPDSGRYIVSFLDEAKGRSALRAAGARILLDLPNQGAAAANIPASALNGLRRNPNIEYIEADAPRFLLSQTTPWGIPRIQADQLSFGGGDIKVCIIDSGYSNLHEDLPDLTAGDATVDPGTGDPLAESSICHHGTHVAGTIAAETNNLGVVGVEPSGRVGLHVIKVFEDDASSPSGCGWGYSSDLVAALDACQAAGADIVNMSLGGPLKSRTEQRAFNSANNAGVLSVAAAGNDGNGRHSYPASYDSVISVAAVDSANTVAAFSQQTSQVELAAPGVAVRSTVTTGHGTEESLSVGGSVFEATGMEGSPDASDSGELYRCNAVDGLGSPGDCAGAPAGAFVCLISRGDITFAEKAQECESAGGAGAIIFNNSAALYSGTLGGTTVGIPVVGVSGTDGATLEGLIGQNATVTTTTGNYAFYDGTSMATPHVAGAAALLWSQDPNCSNDQVRSTLTATALDLGDPGRDNAYGYGLVQVADAAANLDCGGGEPGGGGCPLLPKGASCNSDSECCSSTCKGRPGSQSCK